MPSTKKEVCQFLGLAGYYRRFIPEFASIAAPITDLTRKEKPVRVKWSEECETAFRKLKAMLVSNHMLRSPDMSLQFVLETDDSDRGVGAVLTQVDEVGEEHPVPFFSRKLLPREEKCKTVEKECLAIWLGIEAFRVYLLGRPFTVRTDQRALEWLDRMRDTNSRLTRWSLALQPYQGGRDVRDWTLCMQLVSCYVLYHFIAGCVYCVMYHFYCCCVYCIILSKPVSSSFVVTPLFKCMIAMVLAFSHVV